MFRPTRRRRIALFIVGDMLIWIFALLTAFLVRFDGTIPSPAVRLLPILLAIMVPVKLGSHVSFHLYRISWRMVGLTDMVNVWKANSAATLIIVPAVMVLQAAGVLPWMPRTVLLLDYMLSLGGIAVFRAGRRLWGIRGRRRKPNGSMKRILLIGAGSAGERLSRAMRDDHVNRYDPVGFIDDDPAKHGADIHGLRVFGGRTVISEVVRTHHVDEVVIAIPSAPSRELRSIVAYVRQSGVKHIRILPGVHELLTARVGLQDIREVNLDDLLGRPPVQIQMDAIAAAMEGQRVLVSGAAGSIGGELVRQLSRFPCAEILAVDNNETGLFELEKDWQRLEASAPMKTAVADVRDRDKVGWLLRSFRPTVIFHAAAYKHVPLMERHIEEAVKTNILGTFVLAEAAVRGGVERFILISTDKAVNPSSILGLTKRVAEQVVHSLSQRGQTRFFTVRFGNVLGSRGSLVPVLQDQIRHGGPITLTHPEMRRYFMSPAEAVLLVLEAALMDRRSGIFVLDMGDPVRIVDLAEELVRLSGLEPDKDIPIVFSGVRPGEKMEEELVEDDEELVPTPFDKVREIRINGAPSEMSLRLALQELERLSREMDRDGLRGLLGYLVEAETPVHPLGVSVGTE